MNNEQKAEDYAAKICEIYQSSVHDTRWLHDVATEAVLHGIEIGYVNGLKAARHLPGEAYEDDKTPPIKSDWQPKSE